MKIGFGLQDNQRLFGCKALHSRSTKTLSLMTKETETIWYFLTLIFIYCLNKLKTKDLYQFHTDNNSVKLGRSFSNAKF